MSELPIAPRRWFQFGLAELVLLLPLLAAVWLQSTMRPHSRSNEPQAPTFADGVDRGLTWSTVILVPWVVVRTGLRMSRIHQRLNEAPTRHDSRTKAAILLVPLAIVALSIWHFIGWLQTHAGW